MSVAMGLRVSYKEGKAYAAYLTLEHPVPVRIHRSRELAPDIIVDFDHKGRPLGIEILFPGPMTITRLDRVMKKLDRPPLSRKWVRPLRAA